MGGGRVPGFGFGFGDVLEEGAVASYLCDASQDVELYGGLHDCVRVRLGGKAGAEAVVGQDAVAS